MTMATQCTSYDADDGLRVERGKVGSRTVFHVTEHGRRLPDVERRRTRASAEARIAAIRQARAEVARDEADLQAYLDQIGPAIAPADMRLGQTVHLLPLGRDARIGGRTYTVDHTEIFPNGVVMLHWRGQTTDIGPIIVTPSTQARLVAQAPAEDTEICTRCREDYDETGECGCPALGRT